MRPIARNLKIQYPGFMQYVKILVCLFLILFLISLPSLVLADEKCLKDVCVLTQKLNRGARVSVKNRNTDPVTVTMDLKLENMSGSRCPCTVDLASGEEKLVAELKAGAGRWNYHWDWRWRWGKINQKHDNAITYQLPFDIATPVEVLQGYHGAYSHDEFGGFAVDFKLPEGTKLLAARAGKIVATQSTEDKNWTEKDRKEHGNYIVILHEDGTLAEYIHLKQDGVVAKVGSQVKAGDLIGYSGNTGFTTQPHLHFETYTRIDAYKKIRFPTKMDCKGGLVMNFATGDKVQRP